MIVGGGVIAGVLLAMLFSQVVAMGRSPNQPLTSNKTEQAQRQAPPAKIVSLREKLLQAQKYEPDCEKSEKREDCFLGLRAVWAAEAQAKGAVDQADYTWWGLWVLGFTLVATGIAARAAWNTVQTMQDTARTELRAFVTATNFHFIYHTTSQPDGTKVVHTWEVRPCWENSGTTPARRVINHVSHGMFPPSGLPPNFGFPDHWSGTPKPFVRFLIGPKANVEGEEIRISAALLQQTLQGGNRVYVWGWIEYDDALKGTARHRTEFCIWIDPQGDPTVAAPNCLAVRFDGLHNGADGDCMKQPQTT